MTDKLTSTDIDVLNEINFLRLDSVYYKVWAFCTLILVGLFFASPFMELSDKRLPPNSTTEYFEKLSDPVALAVVIVTLPFFVLVIINWTIKKFELSSGTKTTKRHTVSFKANTRQFRIIGFRPFYFIIYLRHGGLVNLKKGDMVDIEKSSMGRMIKFNKV